MSGLRSVILRGTRTRYRTRVLQSGVLAMLGHSGDQYAIYGYGNDIWKVSRNLSVNLGLRYEFTSTPYGWTQQSLNAISSAPGLITFGSPQAPKKDFMPRVGFAYSPGSSGSMSIRGGFGMGYDVFVRQYRCAVAPAADRLDHRLSEGLHSECLPGEWRNSTSEPQRNYGTGPSHGPGRHLRVLA